MHALPDGMHCKKRVRTHLFALHGSFLVMFAYSNRIFNMLIALCSGMVVVGIVVIMLIIVI